MWVHKIKLPRDCQEQEDLGQIGERHVPNIYGSPFMVGNGTLKLVEDNLASNERGCGRANDSRGSNMARVLMNLR